MKMRVSFLSYLLKIQFNLGVAISFGIPAEYPVKVLIPKPAAAQWEMVGEIMGITPKQRTTVQTGELPKASCPVDMISNHKKCLLSLSLPWPGAGGKAKTTERRKPPWQE